jgi:Spy/CpxP family protein refolding chaperone
MPDVGDRHMRHGQALMALRYGAVYHLLTPEQRAGVGPSMKNRFDGERVVRGTK